MQELQCGVPFHQNSSLQFHLSSWSHLKFNGTLVVVHTCSALPSLFASIDAIICVFQLFLIDTWPAQLECAEEKCFKGPDAAADLWLFNSIPVVVERFTAILEAKIQSGHVTPAAGRRSSSSAATQGAAGGVSSTPWSDTEVDRNLAPPPPAPLPDPIVFVLSSPRSGSAIG